MKILPAFVILAFVLSTSTFAFEALDAETECKNQAILDDVSQDEMLLYFDGCMAEMGFANADESDDLPPSSLEVVDQN